MPAASSRAEDNVKQQYCQAWAKSWLELQQEQLKEYMACIQSSVLQQQSSMEVVMRRSFDDQLRHMQRFFEESRNWNGSIPDFSFLRSDGAHEHFHRDTFKTTTSDLGQPIRDCMLDKTEQEAIGKKTFGLPATSTEREAAPAANLHGRSSDESVEPEFNHRKLKGALNSFRRAVGWRGTVSSPPEQLAHRVKHGYTMHDVPEEPVDEVQARCLKIVNSHFFEGFTAVVVTANTVVIAMEADNALKDALERGSFETMFPRMWNAFDVMIVGSAVIELMFQTINFSFIRVLRVIRMLRIVRVIRVIKVFRQLRLMISSIITSLLTLIWAFVLLSLVVFLFAIVLIQGSANYIEDSFKSSGSIPIDIRRELELKFSSLIEAVYTLLTTVSGGQDWAEIADMFQNMDSLYFCVFLFYQCFVIFGVLNVLTGVFVESATNISRVDHDLVLTTEMSRNESYSNQIEALFVELDRDKSGTVEWEEFKNHLDDPRVHAYFAELQMDVTEARGLFQLLDTYETGSIAIEEFVLGCMRLKGTAKSIDIATMMYETKKQAVHTSARFGDLEERMRTLSVHVNRNTEAVHKNTTHLVALDAQVGRNAELAKHNAQLLHGDAALDAQVGRNAELTTHNSQLLHRDKKALRSKRSSGSGGAIIGDSTIDAKVGMYHLPHGVVRLLDTFPTSNDRHV